MTRLGILRRDEPMAAHTSWRVGGPADLFFEPASVSELAEFLASLDSATPVHWIGLGSNLLVRDGGIRGAVICTSRLPREFARLDDARVRASAGLPCATLARRCVDVRLGPAAFFAGIPGTVGGALAMNAGAFGGETWDRVERVETIDRAGTLRTRARDEFEIGYRSVRGAQGEWFLAGIWCLSEEPEADKSALRAMRRKRGENQPLGRPSAGSVFRNPQGAHAGALIERAGLKGARVGGAVVSEKHANFIVNAGGASASDIEALIEHVTERVRVDSGVELELEVRVLGEQAGRAPHAG